jgi:hypothetical protein
MPDFKWQILNTYVENEWKYLNRGLCGKILNKKMYVEIECKFGAGKFQWITFSNHITHDT